MEAKITPGAAQDAEKLSKNFSGGSPAGTSAEASKSAPGPIFIALKWPPGSRLGPRGSPEASGSSYWVSLGAMLHAFWHRRWYIWRAVLAAVVGLRGVTKQQFSVMCDPPALSRKQPQQPKT